MKVRLTKWGKAHQVATDGDGNATYRTLCGQEIPMSGKELPVRETDGDCVQCRREERIRSAAAMGGEAKLLKRKHKTGPTIGVHPGSTAPKGTMTRPLSKAERDHRKNQRDPKTREMEKHAHRQRMEDRPGFGQFLRGMLPQFLKRGWGG